MGGQVNPRDGECTGFQRAAVEVGSIKERPATRGCQCRSRDLHGRAQLH